MWLSGSQVISLVRVSFVNRNRVSDKVADYQSAIQPIANRRYRRSADWQSAVSPVGNRPLVANAYCDYVTGPTSRKSNVIGRLGLTTHSKPSGFARLGNRRGSDDLQRHCRSPQADQPES
jgi:hypothetical protein